MFGFRISAGKYYVYRLVCTHSNEFIAHTENSCRITHLHDIRRRMNILHADKCIARPEWAKSFIFWLFIAKRNKK